MAHDAARPMPTRRAMVGSALAALVGQAASLFSGVAHAGADLPGPRYHGGRIDPPIPFPEFGCRLADGRRLGTAALLRGRATAVQFIFTGCSTTCPIQGAIFEQVQTLMPGHADSGIQLLSLSISPLEDTPQRLAAWLKRFNARPGWLAGSPEVTGPDPLAGLLGDGRNSLDNHVTAVNIVDRRGELVWRTHDLPPAEQIANILAHV